MNINLRPKKCSGQSRYGRYGSYATEMIELTEVMRQRGDSAFTELLCRVRTNSCTSEDLETLKSREIAPDIANYPTQALHVYRLNTDVDSWNALMLDNLAPQSAQYTIKAIDSIAGQTSHIFLSRLSDKRSETGGLLEHV